MNHKAFIPTILLTASLVSGCLPIGREEIIVDGKASIEAEPDVFVFLATIMARGDTKGEILTVLSETNDRLRSEVPEIEGLSDILITSSGVDIQPTVDPNCPQAERYNAEEFCDLAGYRGVIRVQIEGSPASLAGNVLSYTLEQGASRVDQIYWRLSDRQTHEKKAIEAAIEDARRKAALLAEASNLGIGRPTTIQFGKGLAERNTYYEDESRRWTQQQVARPMLDASAPRAPSVALTLKPDPVVIEAEVTAAFPIKEKSD